MTPGESWAYVGVMLACVTFAFLFGASVGALCCERLAGWYERRLRRRICELENELAQLKGE